MRRVLAMVATTAILLASGCGSKSYEFRLNKTLEDMRYRKRLDDNLLPAPSKGKFTDLMIFVRPPKGLGEPTKEFLLTVLEPNKFDIAESLVEQGKQSLYILGRVKRPKAPAGAKKAAAPVETASRGDFNQDVIAILNSVYGMEIDLAKSKEVTKKNNKYRQLVFEANGKVVHVYLWGSKTNPYEVALIFEFPKAEQANLASKIELTLESFAVGDVARKKFSGAVSEEETGEGGSPTAAPPGVF